METDFRIGTRLDDDRQPKSLLDSGGCFLIGRQLFSKLPRQAGARRRQSEPSKLRSALGGAAGKLAVKKR